VVLEEELVWISVSLVGMDGFVVRLVLVVLAVGSSVEEGREEGIDVMVDGMNG
jgi:hypothetical protein